MQAALPWIIVPLLLLAPWPKCEAGNKISDYATFSTLASGDYLLGLDVSDTSMAPTGTEKKLSLSTLGSYLADLAQTLTNKTLTAPTINGGAVIELTSFSLRSTGAAFDLSFGLSEALTADRAITWNVGDASRAITLGGDISLAGSFITSGAYSLTFTLTGATSLTMPTSGTLLSTASTIDLATQTITGTKAQFNTALSDDNFAFLGAANVFTSTTASTSSNTGAATFDGGIGVDKDSYFNDVKIGQGGGDVSTNTVVGDDSLDGNVLGSNNSVFGYKASPVSSNGSQNVVFGANALEFGNGSNNVIIGYNAGRLITGGGSILDIGTSIFIGPSTQALSDNLSNQIVIGYNMTSLGSNTASIGTTSTTRFQAYGAGYARGHIGGLKLSNNASDATNDIDIAPGEARDKTNARGMVLSSGITKRLDATFTAGTGNGGLDQGVIANATYHVHLIENPTTVATDAIFSLSHDKSDTVTMTIASPCVVTWGVAGRGHGLVAGSTFRFTTTGALPTGVSSGVDYYVLSTGLTETTFQFSTTNAGPAVNSSGTQSGTHTGWARPLMPSGYTYYRRIGMIVRTGGAIQAFRQEGDQFFLDTTALGVETTTLSTSRVLFAMAPVPVGMPLEVLIRGSFQQASAGTMVIVTSPSETDAAPSFSAAPLYSGRLLVAGSTQQLALDRVWTDASAQVAARSTAASTTLRLNVIGWIDRRGKDD